MQFLPILLLFVVAYALIIRPQQQRAKVQRSLLDSLSVGDDVTTVGGLRATIAWLDDTDAQLQVAPGIVLRFDRRAIAKKDPAPADAVEAEDTPAPPESIDRSTVEATDPEDGV